MFRGHFNDLIIMWAFCLDFFFLSEICMIQFSNSGYIIQLHIKWNVFRFEHHQFYFCRTFHTEEVIISYLAQKLVAYLLKLCWTAKVKPLVGVLFRFQWLKPTLDV